MTREEAKQVCIENGIDFNKTWGELSDKQQRLLLELAKKTNYRIKYNPGCSFCETHQRSFKFFYHLQKKVK